VPFPWLTGELRDKFAVVCSAETRLADESVNSIAFAVDCASPANLVAISDSNTAAEVPRAAGRGH